MNNSYFKHHVFFCTNKRDDGRQCCQDHHASEMRAYMKQRIKEEAHSGAGKVRINTAGCLDRCEHGPVLVVYPEGDWYTYVDKDDIDEIISSLKEGGASVQRLLIKT